MNLPRIFAITIAIVTKKTFVGPLTKNIIAKAQCAHNKSKFLRQK